MNDDQKLIVNCKELDDILKRTEECYIYGAGRFCYAFLEYVSIHGGDKVKSIIVSQRELNPDSVMGVEVVCLDEVLLKSTDTIFVAAFEKSHESINQLLTRFEAKVYFFQNDLYKAIRYDNPNLVIDTLNNTQWIRDDLKRLYTRIERLENELKSSNKSQNQRINRLSGDVYRMSCVQKKGGHLYEETLSPSEYSSYLKDFYSLKTGKVLDLCNPQSFNEKIQWTKLYGITPDMKVLADKILAREWVAKKIGEKYLIPLIGTWSKFEDIDFDPFPNRFVLKCNHGSGMNEIVHKKNDISLYWLKIKFDRWMETNFAYCFGLELQYKDITPMILGEEYIESNTDELFDYKFFCFAGKVALIQVDMGRQTHHKRNLYTREWDFIPCSIQYPRDTEAIVAKPNNLSEMIAIAEKLSDSFQHVRVDLYNVDNKIYFGEMTFTHGSGIEKFEPEELGDDLGELFEIDERNKLNHSRIVEEKIKAFENKWKQYRV